MNYICIYFISETVNESAIPTFLRHPWPRYTHDTWLSGVLKRLYFSPDIHKGSMTSKGYSLLCVVLEYDRITVAITIIVHAYVLLSQRMLSADTGWVSTW